MVRTATYTDITQLQTLYSTIFPDCSHSYIKRVFDHKIALDRTVVFEEDSAIVGMSYIWDCFWTFDNKSHTCGYINAVGVLNDYRGRGIMRELMSFSEALMLNNNYDYAVLIPADPYLFDVYKKFGFKTSFYKNKLIYEPAKCVGTFKCAPISDLDCYNLYNKLLKNYSYINRSMKDFSLILDEQKSYNSKIFGVTNAKEELVAYAFANIHKNRLTFPELLSLDSDVSLDVIFASIVNELGFKGDCTAYCPCNELSARSIPFGMYKAVNGSVEPVPSISYMAMMHD